MSRQLLFGTLILIAGVVLVIVGMNASHAVTAQVGNTLRDRFTQGATWYILGGLAAGMAGLYLVLTNLLSKRT